MTRVYVIYDGEFVKVGITTNVQNRLASIRSANTRSITIEYLSPELKNAVAVEQFCHSNLSSRNVSGEWFKCSVDLAVTVVKETVATRGIIPKNEATNEANAFLDLPIPKTGVNGLVDLTMYLREINHVRAEARLPMKSLATYVASGRCKLTGNEVHCPVKGRHARTYGSLETANYIRAKCLK
jgi:hypothetical protein